MKSQYALDSNNHSVFSLNYHLILVTKFRRKVLTDEMTGRLKEIFERIQPSYGITLKEINHDKDHVHILFKAEPKSELSKFINAYKSASSRLLKKEFPEITEKIWGGKMLWSKSFCLLTAGGAPLDIIKAYIEQQGEQEKPSKRKITQRIKEMEDAKSEEVQNLPE